MTRLKDKWRNALLRLRVLDREHAVDPFSPEYLYLVQQERRISLSTTIARLRPRNIPFFPAIIVIAIIKYLDLLITNQIVQSLINERILIRHSASLPRNEGR
jgi:hypothetical protein